MRKKHNAADMLSSNKLLSNLVNVYITFWKVEKKYSTHA